MLNWKKAKKNIEEKETDKSVFTGEKVLLVEDEQQNLLLLEELLSEKFQVVTAANGEEALPFLDDFSISVIVSDQRMPKMSGTEFFAEAEKRGHPASRVILTGFADLKSVIDGVNDGKIFRYITKPIDQDELLQTVATAVRNFQINQANKTLVGMIKNVLEENNQLSRRLSQYETIASDGETSSQLFGQKPQKLTLAILFIDIRGFTRFASTTPPFKVMDTLRSVYKNIHEIIYTCGGFVDKHLGDGLMAVFGLEDQSGVKTGLECMERIVAQSEHIFGDAAEEHDLKLGLGLASGELVVGMIGTEKRSELAIIGQPANLASRLQELTKLPLEQERYKEMFGGFKYAMGLFPTDLMDLGHRTDIKKINISGQINIRDFENIKEISVVAR